MHSTSCYSLPLALLALAACDSTPKITATSSTAATKTTSTAAASGKSSAVASPSSAASATAASAAPLASASASASASAASPCPEGARKNDDARYCITLPPKPLAVSYEGDSPSSGIREELEIKGDRVVISIGAARPSDTAASMKAAAVKRNGAALVDSGDLTEGYWTDAKGRDGKHVLESVVLSKKLRISCVYEVGDDARLEAASAVVKSLMPF